jgi:hypothetical protein
MERGVGLGSPSLLEVLTMTHGRFVGVTAAGLVVGLCGLLTASAAIAPRLPVAQRDGGWMARGANAKHPWLYVSGYYSSNIAIYDFSKVGAHQIGEITKGIKGPCGMSVDSSGTLYVANASGGNVAIYLAGATTPSLTLSQGLDIPTAAAVDSGGNVWVSNRSASDPDIVVFPPGQTTPSIYIKSSLITNIIAEAFDSAGNLYFGDYNQGVSEIRAGSQQPVSLGLIGLPHSNGLTIEPISGDIFVQETSGSDRRIFVYAPGNPHSIRTLQGVIAANSMDHGTVNGQEYIFAPDALSNDVYLFRKTGKKPWTSFLSATNNVCGVAYKPAGVP